MSQEGQGWVGWTERGRKMVGCFFFFLHLKVFWHLCSTQAGCFGMCIWSIAAWRRVPRTLGAWEVLLEYLSCLASYFV